jgi:hypothetical protein
MANPRANKDIEDNNCYKHLKYLKIVYALYKWKEKPEFGYQALEDTKTQQATFSDYHDYHRHMLKGITFSMVETFKANLAKEMSNDFEIHSGSLDNFYAKSPTKI